jgi:hypothetical protein
VEVLPSQQAVQNLVDGKPGSLREVLLTTAGRAGIIGLGLYVADISGSSRAQKKRSRSSRILRQAIYAAVAVEAFVFLWTKMQKQQ